MFVPYLKFIVLIVLIVFATVHARCLMQSGYRVISRREGKSRPRCEYGMPYFNYRNATGGQPAAHRAKCEVISEERANAEGDGAAR